MTSEHLTRFHGLPVFTFPEAGDPETAELPAPGSVAWRLDALWHDDRPFASLWREFLGAVDSAQVRALVIGPWWHDEYTDLDEVLEPLVADADRFPELRALFLADVVGEECEISWIQLGDITPVLNAFPLLEKLTTRGGENLVLQPVRHEALRVLRCESGGLPPEFVRAVGACDFPALDHLELWLGTSWYGGDSQLPDVMPILEGGARFPRLRHLGLQNSDIQDEIATAVAGAPIVAQLESLTLSMGVLSDEGAAALLTGQPLTHLRQLDLCHHFLSDPMMQRLRSALEPHSVEVDLSFRHMAGHVGGRYVAVGE
ncbi:STM4015 family protein [Streptomyces sannanensis]|uniref:STM4015 family protein n=1 Tax=Streptomyces sannanensis TaxID=285536 RepID=A0ABP6SK20_9ACTN